LDPNSSLEGRKTNTREFWVNFRKLQNPNPGKGDKTFFDKMKEFFLKKSQKQISGFFIFFKNILKVNPYLNPMLRNLVSAFPECSFGGVSPQ